MDNENNDNFETKEDELRKLRNEAVKKVVQKIPRNTTLSELKIAYINHVMTLNDHNRTLTALELGLNYTTIMGLLKRGEIKSKKPKTGRPRTDE